MENRFYHLSKLVKEEGIDWITDAIKYLIEAKPIPNGKGNIIRTGTLTKFNKIFGGTRLSPKICDVREYLNDSLTDVFDFNLDGYSVTHGECDTPKEIVNILQDIVWNMEGKTFHLIDKEFCENWLYSKIHNIQGIQQYLFDKQRRRLFMGHTSYRIKHVCGDDFERFGLRDSNQYISNNMMKITMIKMCDRVDDDIKILDIFDNGVNFYIKFYAGEVIVKKIKNNPMKIK
jgi:hypothetical protein